MKIRAVFVAAVSLAFVYSAPAFAYLPFYIGGSGGQAWINVNEDEIAQGFAADDGFVTSGTVIDNSDTAGKAYFGVRGNRFFSIELGYVDLGKATFVSTIESAPPPYDALTPFRINATAEATGYNVVFVSGIPVDPLFLFINTGGFYWTADFVERIPGVDTPRVQRRERDVSLTFGAGLEVRFTETVAARVEWERFEDVGAGIGGRDGRNVDLASAGLVISF